MPVFDWLLYADEDLSEGLMCHGVPVVKGLVTGT